MAASDFARAENLLRGGFKDLAGDSIDSGCVFLTYLFEDDPSLKSRLPSKEECENYLNDQGYSDIHGIYLTLMELGGAPDVKGRAVQ